MKNLILTLATLSICSISHAGFNGVTHSSRANCGNNESISWDWKEDHMFRVMSYHSANYRTEIPHIVDTGWANTWRSAAVHWGEGNGGWKVLGQHYMQNELGENYLAASEEVEDCSMYDGWWDKKKDSRNHFVSVMRGFHIEKDNKKINLSKEKLFIETSNKDKTIIFFLKLKSNAPQEIKEFNDSKDKYDTHLKSDLSKIELSFSFVKPTVISEKEIIGYAAIGSYKNGWNGIRIFFEKENIGICSYSYQNYISISAPESKIKYFIHKKPSFKLILGNNNTGFMYKISWNDDKKISVDEYLLECVNKNLDERILDKMVALSNQIDISK